MLLGAIGCQQCSCQACVPCDAVCDETPDEAFAVVYQVEDQRANLTWTGDAMGPIDGPWPGFENDPGPYTQEITSGSIALPGTRFPCHFRLKLWRNVGGGEGSDALDNERVTISCTQGKVNLGVVVLNAGESLDITTDPENSTATYAINGTRIALDTNGGDRHAHPPTFWQVSGAALCANTSVTVQASIQWSNDLIQHNLYGEFQECFDEPPDPPGGCKIDCDGTEVDTPPEVFLTISNATESSPPYSGYSLTFPDIEGTFTLGEFACRFYADSFSVTDGEMSAGAYYGLAIRVSGYPFSAPDPTQLWSPRGGGNVVIAAEDYEAFLCGDVATLSGTMTIDLSLLGAGGGNLVPLGSYTIDWELTL